MRRAQPKMHFEFRYTSEFGHNQVGSSAIDTFAKITRYQLDMWNSVSEERESENNIILMVVIRTTLLHLPQILCLFIFKLSYLNINDSPLENTISDSS